MARSGLDPHPEIVASGRSICDRFGLAQVPFTLLLLTLGACLVRASGIPAVQGTMGRDEARLALAARGILEHGLPILGDSFLDTRGLVPAYLNAATFAILGSTDYLGKTDFWLRTDGYSKYVWAGRAPLRDVQTGAIVIRSQAELEKLLVVPYRGRTVWVVLAGDPATESSRELRELARQLTLLAAETRRRRTGASCCACSSEPIQSETVAR